MPPGHSTRSSSAQTSSRTACIASKARSPSPSLSASSTSGFIDPNASSHISTIGYGGDVTTSSTLLSASARSRESPTTIRWVVSIVVSLSRDALDTVGYCSVHRATGLVGEPSAVAPNVHSLVSALEIRSASLLSEFSGQAPRSIWMVNTDTVYFRVDTQAQESGARSRVSLWWFESLHLKV